MAIPNSPRHPPLTENTPLLYSPPPPPSIPANTPIPPYYQPRTRRSQYPSPSRSITPIQTGSAVSTPGEDYSTDNHYEDEHDFRSAGCCCCGSLVDFLLFLWRIVYTYCCGCLGSRRGRGVGARRPIIYSRSPSESSFHEYIPSREFSPSRSQTNTTTIPELERRGRGGGVGLAIWERLGDEYSPYSPHSPYSPYAPGLGAGAVGGVGQQDYFSPRGSYNHTTSLPHAPQPPQCHNYGRYIRDPEPDLRPGYTSHFLPGSYSRTATNTQPTTRANTNTVPSPRSEEETDEYNSGSGAIVAYGHGYDATRQRMVYRRILATDQETAAGGGGVDRGYEGGDEGTETGTSTSVIGSANASGRTSPYEERGRSRRGSRWWGTGYGFGSSPGGWGRRRREMSDEDIEAETMEGPHGDYYGEVDPQDHHRLARPRWSVGAIDGLVPSPVSPAVTAIRYGSNDNTPRPVHILDVVHRPTPAGGVSGQTELRHGEMEPAPDLGATLEQGGGDVHVSSSGVDDLIPLPPALDSGSEIDLSPSSAAAAELEQLRNGSVSGILANTDVQSQRSPAAVPPAQGASAY